MTSFIKAFFDFIWNYFYTVDSILSFEIFGYRLGLMSLFVGFIVLGMVVSVFWKGAKD